MAVQDVASRVRLVAPVLDRVHQRHVAGQCGRHGRGRGTLRQGRRGSLRGFHPPSLGAALILS